MKSHKHSEDLESSIIFLLNSCGKLKQSFQKVGKNNEFALRWFWK